MTVGLELALRRECSLSPTLHSCLDPLFLGRAQVWMGPAPDPFLWGSIFISKMREELIFIFQHLFLVPKVWFYQPYATVTQCFERSCLPKQMTFTTNRPWILASLETDQCHHTSLIKFPPKAKAFFFSSCNLTENAFMSLCCYLPSH